MSLMSVQVFVRSAELARTQTHTYKDAHAHKTRKKAIELEGRLDVDEVQTVFLERKGIKKRARGLRSQFLMSSLFYKLLSVC